LATGDPALVRICGTVLGGLVAGSSALLLSPGQFFLAAALFSVSLSFFIPLFQLSWEYSSIPIDPYRGSEARYSITALTRQAGEFQNSPA